MRRNVEYFHPVPLVSSHLLHVVYDVEQNTLTFSGSFKTSSLKERYCPVTVLYLTFAQDYIYPLYDIGHLTLVDTGRVGNG